MYVLIIVHGSTPDDNEYYGPFDTSANAEAYIERLADDRGHNADDYDWTIQSMGSPSL
jgi:hypothetical protein